MDITIVWRNILAHEGEDFRTVRGKPFSYTVYGDYLIINDDKRIRVTKSALKASLEIPYPSPSKISAAGIWAPSYIYGLITDRRIIY